MGVYDRQIAAAKRLIAKYGQTQNVTWRSKAAAVPVDSTKKWKGSVSASVDHIVSIAFMDVSRIGSESQHPINQAKLPATQRLAANSYSIESFSELTVGQMLGYMGAVTFNPSSKDIVIRNRIEYRISNISTINPNGQAILYIIEFEL